MTTISNLNSVANLPAFRDSHDRDSPLGSQKSVATAIKDTLDLSAQSRRIPESFHSLSDDDKNEYLKNLARLLKIGIVGTETLQVRGESYVGFTSTRFVDPEVTHARLTR